MRAEIGSPVTSERPCSGCGETFVPKYPEQRFHSQPCFMRSYNKANADGHSNRGAKKGGAKRGAQLREDARPGRSYAKVPGTDIHEHRAVAEEILGRPLVKGEVVHHEDRVKRNNNPNNLIVFGSQADHARHHKQGHSGQSSCACVCIRLSEVIA